MFIQNSLFPYVIYIYKKSAFLRFIKSKKKWTCATWGSIDSCAADIAFIAPLWDNVRTVCNYWSDTLANRTCRSCAESCASHGKSIIVASTCAWRSYVRHCPRTRGVLVKSVLQTIAGKKTASMKRAREKAGKEKVTRASERAKG